MMYTKLPVVLALAVLVTPAPAQQLPPIRQIGPVVATSRESLGPVVSVRHLPAGVLVNDPQRQRLLLLDASLRKTAVVADSTSATANAYSGRIGGLIAYRGDSSLFLDPQSMSMLVIDGAGKVVRVMAVPSSRDAMMLAAPGSGTPAFDAAGRLVYRGLSGIMNVRHGPAGPGIAGPPQIPDSAAVIRMDLTTRRVDTVAFIRTPRVKIEMEQSDGRTRMRARVNPLPVVDDWAVLSDGSIAIVRGRDYHVDWVRPDGSPTSSPKMPFEWQRLTDEDKVAFIDSVKAVRARMAADGTANTAGGIPIDGLGLGGDGHQAMVSGGHGGGGAGGSHGGAGGGAGAGAGGVARMIAPQIEFVPPNELPDYKPPFFAGAVRADAEGCLWIQTIPTKPIAGGPVYDVVNGKGELVDRVQIRPGRTIIGFGSGDIVYMLWRDRTTMKLEKAAAR